MSHFNFILVSLSIYSRPKFKLRNGRGFICLWEKSIFWIILITKSGKDFFSCCQDGKFMTQFISGDLGRGKEKLRVED